MNSGRVRYAEARGPYAGQVQKDETGYSKEFLLKEFFLHFKL